MPYASDSEVPSRIKGKKARHQWRIIWNEVFNSTGDEGKAFAEANSVYNNRTKKVDWYSDLHKSDSVPYPDTGEYDEDAEEELRQELVIWGDYAEDGPSFDQEGKYLCGSCQMRSNETFCTRVVSPISFETGSCRIFIIGDEGGGEPMPQKLTQIQAAYTERPEVKGFGCTRCEYGGEAKEEDSEGRKGWCSFWGCHVEPLACCFMNTGDDDVFAPISGDKDKTSEKTVLDIELEKLVKQVSRAKKK